MENKPIPTSNPKPDSETQLRIFRECLSAGMAFLIVLGSFVTIGVAITLVDTPEQFSLAKDLLLFINPILGVAVGYFFNKVTSDARAETAERAVVATTTSAQQATEGQRQALAEAQDLRHEADEMQSALSDVAACAENMMSQAESAMAPGTLGIERGGAPGANPDEMRARLEMQSSLNRAQKWVKNR